MKTIGAGQVDTHMEIRGKELNCSLPRQFVRRKRKGTPSLTKQKKDFKAKNGKIIVRSAVRPLQKSAASSEGL